MDGLSFLLAQAPAPKIPEPAVWLQWLYVVGEPSVTNGKVYTGLFGPLLTWLLGGLLSWSKVVGLFCLLAWVVGWLLAKPKGSVAVRSANPIKLYLLLGIVFCFILAALLSVLDQTKLLPLREIGRIKPALWLALLSGGGLLALIEWQLWSTLRQRKARADIAVLIGVHLAVMLGIVVAVLFDAFYNDLSQKLRVSRRQFGPSWTFYAPRLGATYAGLLVLVRIAWVVAAEATQIRWNRIYAIAWQSVIEAIRRMWAPQVVLTLFVIFLAFTHWFLRADDRPAELSRMFVGYLCILTTILLLIMVGIVSPIGMPNDIQQQTIYTVVSKPVRRLELIWGRLVGYMTLATVLSVIFGIVSLVYLDRTVGLKIQANRDLAEKFAKENRPDFARQRAEEADQLATRMSARVPIKGSLTFRDSMAKERKKGIDVGQEQEVRSHIEGATPSRAIWHFGFVPDPFEPRRILDHRIPVASLLTPGTIEAVEDRYLNLIDERATAANAQAKGTIKAGEASKIAAEQQRRGEEIARVEAELRGLKTREEDFRKKLPRNSQTPETPDTREIKRQIAELHSPPIPIEMTFNIYRTTKGVLGERVLASLRAFNPRPGTRPHGALFPIHEYYTNRQALPASVIVGSRGVLTIEVGCETPNQYLGMSEPDLYILASQGSFQVNFLKGLFGIWLQAMVLTAIGLFAGSFLSWPVALLTTIAFFIFGALFFPTMAQISIQAQELTGGGPFESFVRLSGHQNMMADLAPTPAVIAAKTLDTIVLPVMSRLVYIVPNFGALDVSNTVSEGFAVTWGNLRDLLLMGIGYALPFTVAGYFILKNREVAA